MQRSIIMQNLVISGRFSTRKIVELTTIEIICSRLIRPYLQSLYIYPNIWIGHEHFSSTKIKLDNYFGKWMYKKDGSFNFVTVLPK